MIRPDSILVPALKVGEEKAYHELVAAYKQQVYAICFRLLMNREDAEDTAQEVFLEIFHSVKSFRGDASLSTWIHRIAVSKSLELIRKQKRKKRMRWLTQWLGAPGTPEPVATGDPFSSLEQKDQEYRLQKALDQLPENQRVALTLSFVEGLSNPQIAAVLHTTVEAVEALKKRARNRISQVFKKARQKK